MESSCEPRRGLGCSEQGATFSSGSSDVKQVSRLSEQLSYVIKGPESFPSVTTAILRMLVLSLPSPGYKMATTVPTITSKQDYVLRWKRNLGVSWKWGNLSQKQLSTVLPMTRTVNTQTNHWQVRIYPWHERGVTVFSVMSAGYHLNQTEAQLSRKRRVAIE